MTSAVREDQELSIWDKIKLARQGAGLGTEVAAGLALDYKTQPLLYSPVPGSRLLYGAINFGGAATANYAAQKVRGEERINWGEVISSGLLGIVPFTDLRFARYLDPNQARLANRVAGRANTLQRAVVGGSGMGVADQFIQSGWNEGELPSAGDVATGALAGGAFGGTFKTITDQAGPILRKFANKSPDEINKTITPQELETLNQLRQNIIKAQDEFRETGNPTNRDIAVEALNEARFNIEKQQGKHSGIIDYKHYKTKLARWQGNLKDTIDGNDPFFKFKNTADQTKGEKFLEKYRDKEKTVRGTYAGIDRALEINPNSIIDSSQYRKVAGHIFLDDIDHRLGDGTVKTEPGVISLLKQINAEMPPDKLKEPLTISDAVKYLEIQKRGNKEMREAIDYYNAYRRAPTVAALRKDLDALANRGILRGNTVKKLLRALRSEEARIYVEKGHKKALWELFLNATSGGDRLSNTFLEYVNLKEIRDVYGNLLLPAKNINRSRKADKDLPLYTLIKLKGGTRNLKEDIKKTLLPKEFPSESIPEEWEDFAEIFYRNMFDEGMTQIKSGPNYDADMSVYSFALTDGIFEMIEAAIDLDIPVDIIEDIYLIKLKRMMPKKVKKYLDDVFISTINKQIKALGGITK